MANPTQPLAVRVAGPLTDGQHGWPFGATDLDLEARGYVMEEFILTGTAESLRLKPGAEARADGHWDVEADQSAPFATRALVVRPRDAADFNGVAVVNWLNVTAGFDLGAPMSDEYYRGYAWIGVTAQRIGVEGVPGQTRGLTAWDQERYGSLAHPGDAYSYDIFSQAGRLARGDAPAAGPSLLGELRPQTILASGGSQSAMRLGSYLNAAHQRHRVFDGFLLTVHWGICPPLEEVELMTLFEQTADGQATGYFGRIRDDGNVRILNLATECEARFNYPVRQDESDTFRFWELAGAAHQSPSAMAATAAMGARDGTVGTASPPDANATEWRYVSDAALRALVSWVRDGVAPRSLPRIVFADGAIVRDEFGNALGGVRLPEVEAPTATNTGERGDGPEAPNWLRGSTTPLSAKQLAALYPSRSDFETRWRRAVEALVEQGVLLPEDVESVLARGSG